MAPSGKTCKGTGDWGEEIAAQTLAGKGYAICDRNWRSGHYELDIVAMKGSRIVFVEVKTRSGRHQEGADAVDLKKMRRLIYAANAYIQAKDIPFEYQFDIITVTGSQSEYTVEHIEDAFLPPAIMAL